jgi:hypothetical protein
MLMRTPNSDLPDRATDVRRHYESDVKAKTAVNESDVKVRLNWDIPARSRMKARRSA